MVTSVISGFLYNVPRVALAPLRLWRRSRACPRGAWVHLVVEGEVSEIRRPQPLLLWSRRPLGLGLDRLHALVDSLLDDPAPAGLLVTIRRLSASAAARTAFRSELLRLRAANKRVVVHLPEGGSVGELLLASAASRLIVGAQTTFGPLGFQAGALYWRNALDRVGLVADIHTQGDYKTAGENLALSAMSEPQREQLNRLLTVLHEELVGALADGRRVSREVAAGWIDRGLLSSEDALREGLVDAVLHDDEVLRFLEDSPSEKDAITVGAGTYLSRRSPRMFGPIYPRKTIAILEGCGPIVPRSPGVGAFFDAETTVQLIEKAAEANQVAGVVLYLDTPGGGILASEKIHRAVTRLAEKKPVVACFGGIAASGGYYVASGCHAIVARETTVTGSIGVVAARVLTGPLLERLGVRSEVVTRGAHADMLRSTRPFSDAERVIFRAELERAYHRFLSLVADGRKRALAEIEPLAGGRIWSGQDALARGLVDRIGGLEEALEEVRSRARLTREDAQPVLWRPSGRHALGRLLELLPVGASLQTVLDTVAPLPELALALASNREPVLALGWLWPSP
ncbi:MAG: signal peptide peptidase SppA [Myxococcales bacterium]|nr:signal peptide peptidase SppA [Polyangiaceae bacterium]MDW8250070.1 signal peptide peptidase SppA [Myxococcales bacterium]